MPVDHQHQLYKRWLPTWRQNRAVCDGARAVKGDEVSTELLPPLSGHDRDGKGEAYRQYLASAHFFPGASRALAGFTGLLNQDPAVVVAPAALKPFLDDVTSSGSPITAQEFTAAAVMEVCKVGRCGVFTDYPERALGVAPPNRLLAERLRLRPRWRLYAAESIWDWHEVRVGERTVLAYVLLHERQEVPAPTEDDEFAWEEFEQLRLLDRAFPPIDLDERSFPDEALPANGGDGRVYRSRLYRRDAQDKDKWVLVPGTTAFPRVGGKLMAELPFDFGGSRTASPDVDRPPLDDAVTVNIGHYRNSAAHEHGLYFTANPMAYLFGFDQDQELSEQDIVRLNGAKAEIRWTFGSSKMLVLKNAQAQADVLSASAEDLSAVREAMAEKRDELVAVVGRILAQEKKAAEAAKTEELRREGERGVLTTVARAVSAMMTRALQRAQAWTESAEGEVSVKVSTEFFAEGFTPDDALKIAELWVKHGLIAKSDVRKALRRGGIIDAERTDKEIDSELSREPIPSADPALLAEAAALAAAGGKPAPTAAPPKPAAPPAPAPAAR